MFMHGSFKYLLRCLFLFILPFFLITDAYAVTIGVSFPNTTSQRWKAEGEYLKSFLEEDGYDILFSIAENDSNTQIKNIEKMIADDCKVLVIACVDELSLTDVLAKAKAQNIKVIAYDRLIRNTDAIDYFATFDHYEVGVKQAKYIVDRLHLGITPKTYNIELFSGSPLGNVAKNIYEGSMSVLKPYFDNGILVCPSGQISFDETSTMHWKGSEAQKRLRSLFDLYKYEKNKGEKSLDIILGASDSIATALVKSLVSEYGYKSSDIPLITGQDCSLDAARYIGKGLQSMCVFKDSRVLAYQVKEMINCMLEGVDVPVNDNLTYHNGVKNIPTYLCSSVAVDRNNLKEILVESEYYSAKDLK